MTIVNIREDDVEMALGELEGVARRHGSARAMELAAAQARANGMYIERLAGPSVAAEVLNREAQRLITEAAAALAVPSSPAAIRDQNLTRKLAQAATWTVGLLGGFLLGYGISTLGLIA